MAAMDVDWDVFLHYCVIDQGMELTTDPGKVKERGISTGVEAGISFGDALNHVKREAGVGREDEVHRLRLKPPVSWVAISSLNLNYVCKKGDEFYFRITRRHLTTASSWEGSRPVDELLKHYSRAAVAARSVQEQEPQQALDLRSDDLGVNFEVIGRGRAFDAILKGAGSMFRKFLYPRTDYVEDQRQGESYFTMVAFPGAGKTTIGRRCHEFLGAHWMSLTDEDKQDLMGLSAPEYKIFDSMATNSLRYNIHMFHTVEHQSGNVLPEEEGLIPQRILALRCLFSIVHNTTRESVAYGTFLRDLDRKCPGLKVHLSFADVLEFLRRALDVADDLWLQPSFFWDEMNAVSTAADGKVPWIKPVLSAFVRETHSLAVRKVRTFPTMVLASTKYTGGDLKFTECAKSVGRIIPVQPLTLEESRETVLGFVNRLVAKDHPPVEKLGKWVEDILLPLAGGMPRLLGLGLGCICRSEVPDKDQLVGFLTSDTLGEGEIQRIEQEWEYKARGKYTWNTYLGNPNMRKLLLRALAASLLYPVVQRSQCVHEDYTDREEYRWGALEDAGLVSLQPIFPYTMDQGTVDVSVRCSPFLVRQIARYMDFSWPSVTINNYRIKERGDAATILLRAYLLHVSYGRLEFTLKDVLPPGAWVPHQLENVVYRLMYPKYRLGPTIHNRKEWLDIDLLRACASAKECSALTGPGNFGADSYVFCEIVGPPKEKKVVTFVVQSKQTTADASEFVSTILRNFKRDIGKVFPLPKGLDGLISEFKARIEGAMTASSDRQLRPRAPRPSPSDNDEGEAMEVEEEPKEKPKEPLPSYVYLFMSTNPINLEQIIKVQAAQELDLGIVCYFEQDSVVRGDPISILAQVRRVKG